jgi:hypothetical protein
MLLLPFKKLLLSDSLSHDLLSDLPDFLLFFLLLLLFLHDRSPGGLLRCCGLCRLKLSFFMTLYLLCCVCAGLCMNFVSDVSHGNIVILGSVRVVTKLQGVEVLGIVHVEVRRCDELELMLVVVRDVVELDLVSGDSL